MDARPDPSLYAWAYPSGLGHAHPITSSSSSLSPSVVSSLRWGKPHSARLPQSVHQQRLHKRPYHEARVADAVDDDAAIDATRVGPNPPLRCDGESLALPSGVGGSEAAIAPATIRNTLNLTSSDHGNEEDHGQSTQGSASPRATGDTQALQPAADDTLTSVVEDGEDKLVVAALGSDALSTTFSDVMADDEVNTLNVDLDLADATPVMDTTLFNGIVTYITNKLPVIIGAILTFNFATFTPSFRSVDYPHGLPAHRRHDRVRRETALAFRLLSMLRMLLDASKAVLLAVPYDTESDMGLFLLPEFQDIAGSFQVRMGEC